LLQFWKSVFVKDQQLEEARGHNARAFCVLFGGNGSQGKVKIQARPIVKHITIVKVCFVPRALISDLDIYALNRFWAVCGKKKTKK
jgi:hypothetical protein